MFTEANQFARRLLPERMYHSLYMAARRIGGHRTRYQPDDYPERKDVNVLVVQPGVELVLFWKRLPIGTGPAVSLFIHGSELIKFDCFGPGRGHYHIEQGTPVRPTKDRLHLIENSMPAQIERAAFELEHNLEYYVQRHFRRRVRRTDIDSRLMRDTLSSGLVILYGYLKEGSELNRKLQSD